MKGVRDKNRVSPGGHCADKNYTSQASYMNRVSPDEQSHQLLKPKLSRVTYNERLSTIEGVSYKDRLSTLEDCADILPDNDKYNPDEY